MVGTRKLYTQQVLPALLWIVCCCTANLQATDTNENAAKTTIKTADVKIIPVYGVDSSSMLYRQRRIYATTENFSPISGNPAEIGAVNPKAIIAQPTGNRFKCLIDSKSSKSKTANLLRIDTNKDGSFKGDPAVAIGSGRSSRPIVSKNLRVKIDSIMGKIAVKGSYLSYKNRGNDYKRLSVGLYSRVQCELNIDGKNYLVAISDHDSNLKYGSYTYTNNKDGQTRRSMGRYDMVSVYEISPSGKISKQPLAENYHYMPVKIGSHNWIFKYSASDHTITATKENAGLAALKLSTADAKVIIKDAAPEENTAAKLSYCTSDKENLLPAGTYSIHSYEISKSGWSLSSYSQNTNSTFTVEAGKENTLSAALPLRPRINASKSGSNEYSLSFRLYDANNQRCSISHGNERLPYRLVIKNSKGRIIHRGKFEYG